MDAETGARERRLLEVIAKASWESWTCTSYAKASPHAIERELSDASKIVAALRADKSALDALKGEEGEK